MNITKHENKTPPEARIKNINQRGFVLWFTGLSGSGKSTIAMEVEAELTGLGFCVYVLDGDNLRHGITSNLGFAVSDRYENVRRVYEAAELFRDAQIITIVSLISAFEKPRLDAKEKIGEKNFCEVYIKADIETCRTRDPKGLYAKAEAGEIADFTGVSSPYEEPKRPDIVIDTREVSIKAAVKIIVGYTLEKQLEFLLPKILEDGIHAAFDAGREILEIYKKDFKIEYKDDNSPLTEADKKSNELICGRLKKYAPYIDILTEESADDKKRLENKFCFIIDPLDGTKEFIKKNGEFTVNIGLAYKNKSILGIVYAPYLNKLYYAAKNHGAYALCLGADIFKLFSERNKIKVSGKTADLTVVKSRSHSDKKTEALLEKNKHKIKSTADVGSALKGCLIAEGAADVYYRFGYTMEWDTCAMQCVVEESGGVFMQGDLSPMTYNRENSLNERGFIILNKIENKFDSEGI
ncbi:MAG: 3'(2'),5'-bisphosphate nucleotidase CysQ [Oscillospiraceae bacterium]|nr:3'(2'),5'-bisphosphate nucleotidase CysQ [Oscillospiraceae bacterium]